MVKKEQSYKNDDLMYMIEKHFKNCGNMTKREFELIKSTVHYFREKRRK